MSLIKVDNEQAAKLAEQAIRGLGLNLSSSDEAALVHKLSDRVYFDPERREGFIMNQSGGPEIAVENGVVRELTFGQAVAREVGKVARSSPAPSKPATLSKADHNLTERMTAALSAERSVDGRKALAAAEVERAGNPWSKRRWNLSVQGLVTNLHPELASQLKAAAGVSS